MSAKLIYQFYIQIHSKQVLCPFKNPLSSSANVKSICLCFIRNTFSAMFSECVSTYFFSQQLEHTYNKWPLIISPQSSIRCASYNTTLYTSFNQFSNIIQIITKNLFYAIYTTSHINLSRNLDHVISTHSSLLSNI